MFTSELNYLRYPRHLQMNRSLVACALALVVSGLSACSDGVSIGEAGGNTGADSTGQSTDGNGDTTGGTGSDSSGDSGAGTETGSTDGSIGSTGANPDVPATDIQADSSVTPIAAGVRTRAYIGTFGTGSGVFLLDANSRLTGLVFDANNSAQSVRADLEGAQPSATFRQYTHLVEPSENGVQLMPFATGGSASGETTTSAVVEIVDGQSINTVGGDFPINLAAASSDVVLPVSVQSLQGNWSGNYSLCDGLGQNCSLVSMDLSINGNQINGSSSVLASDGTNLLPSAVEGTLTQHGLVLSVSMSWNTYVYDGLAYVDAQNRRQLLLVTTTDSEVADQRMLASALVRTQ